jgi:ribose 1,5-bisphosphokinase
METGRVIYVMGPSGAGKDSVIQYARRKLDGASAIAFAHRYITRPQGGDIETYIDLSPAEFAQRSARGLFALEWSAYGFRYGVGLEIGLWCAAGLSVVIDGSREHFLAHRAALAAARPVLVTASEDACKRRLAARGRDQGGDMAERLARGAAFALDPAGLVVIDNSARLETAGEALVAALQAAAA